MTKKIKKISDYQTYDDWAAASVGTTKKQMDQFLKLALEDFEKDSDVAVLLVALRQIAKAKCGMVEISNKTGLTRESLYKILSKDGNPTLTTFKAILDSLGYCLSVKSIRHA